MTNRADYSKHSACLAAIFIIGDAVITLPDLYYGGAILPGFFIAAAFSVAVYFLSLLLCRGLSQGGIFKKILLVLFLLSAAVYAFWNGAHCVLDFLSFADKILLPGGEHFAVAFIFLFTAAVLSVKKNDVILKLSLIIAPFFILAVIIFFLLTAKNFEFENIALHSMPTFTELKNGTAPFLFGTALPAVLMLHAVTVCFTVPKERQDGLITAYFKGWFVAPFVCIGRFFGAIGSAFGRGKASKNGTAVRVGLIMGIPLAALCAALLINADAAMQLSIGRFFEGLRIGAVIWRAIAALAAAVLFFSFIYYMAYEPKTLPETPYQRIIPAVAAKIAVGMLLTLYVVYAIFQFAYLTGLKGLPEGLTYSQYAVQGFSELCAVSIINIGVYALFSTAAEEDTALRRFLAGLMLSAFVLLMCAAFRLYMYIDAYGLTLRRILSAWFMVCILAAVIICIVRLYDKKLRAVQAMAITAAVLYAALNLINIDAMIAQSVLKKSDARGYMTELDARYLAHELSSDADGVIAKSERWREQVYKMVE